MAEVKNAFIKSKMNKDLDARLIPNGEYRDAKNIQVSRSQGDDVGALENILGNAVTVNGDFATDAGAIVTGSDVLTSSITTPLSNGTAGTYNPTYSGGSGSGLVLSATVTNATTVSISVTASGSGYSVGDVITINSNQLGTGSSGPVITLQTSLQVLFICFLQTIQIHMLEVYLLIVHRPKILYTLTIYKVTKELNYFKALFLTFLQIDLL
mgnify:CR=1 FL=1